jgi:alpha-D-ribose 1-methylphosphonate 5-triphosphate diphosphatase
LATHDDETVEHVAEAAALGITISEFPVTLEAAKAAHDGGMTVLMGAPNLIRGGSHSGNVSAAELVEAGLMDAFASDYVPVSLLHAAWKLTHDPFGWSLPDAIATVAARPAAAAGLTDRGEIVVGKRADLVRVGTAGAVPMARMVWRAGHRVC